MPPFSRRSVLLYAGVFILALVVRVAYLVEMSDAPMFSILVGDSRTYDRWAREIAAGDWLGEGTFYQAPLYPYFLGILFRVFGHSLAVVRAVQAMLGALSCVWLALAGREFFSRRVGVLAGVLVAVYPPAVFFDGMIQKAGMDLFFMTLLLLLVGIVARRRTGWMVLATGVCLGCFSLTRENALVLAVVLVPWLVVAPRPEPTRRRLGLAAVFLTGMAIALLPVGLRNRIVGGEFLLTTSQAGTNFFIGNHEGANGRHRPFVPGREMPEYEQGDATAIAEADVGRALSPREVSRYWRDRALSYIRSQPLDWGRLMVRKWLLVWNRHEIPDTESLEVHTDYSRVLAGLAPLLHLGVVAPLAAVGVAVTWSERRRLWVLYLMVLSLAGAVAIFYVFARYRYPIVPPLILFAAAGIWGMVDRWRDGRVRSLAGCLVLGAAAAIVTNWPMAAEVDPRPLTFRNVAVVLLEDGRPEEAADMLERSVQAGPELPGPRFDLARTLVRLGRNDEAVTQYRELIRIDPEHVEARDNLGALLVRRGDLDEAARHFEATLRLRPDNVVARNNLGVVRNLQGDPESAASLFRDALAIDPSYAEARRNLADVLVVRARDLRAGGRSEEGRRRLEEALRLVPDHEAARRELERQSR